MPKSPNRRRFLQSAATLPLILGSRRARAENQPPNIVLIVADDLGYADLSCYGSPDIRTPVIDSIAGGGVRFTNFYSNAPECTPTRTALLTGRYQQRVGGLECAIGVGNVGRYDDAIRLAEAGELGLPPSAGTLPQWLREAGYANAIAGKWHLGYEDKFRPSRHGFDHFFGALGGNMDYFFHAEASGLHTLALNGRLVRREGHLTDLITAEALRFLRSQSTTRPFFLYVPYTAPHSPYQGPGDATPFLLTEEEWNQGERSTYVEMVEQMDGGVGEILSVLEQRGMAENTLVIFMSDNGANRMGDNRPFSGYKSTLFEGGIHVPCVARMPGVLPTGTESQQVCLTMDFTASIARLAGAEPNRPLDGVDILRGVAENREPEARPLFWRARRGDRTWKAARDGVMKYIRREDGNEVREYLFNLDLDPAEQNNLIDSPTHPATVADLRAQLERWEMEVRPTR